MPPAPEAAAAFDDAADAGGLGGAGVVRPANADAVGDGDDGLVSGIIWAIGGRLRALVVCSAWGAPPAEVAIAIGTAIAATTAAVPPTNSGVLPGRTRIAFGLSLGLGRGAGRLTDTAMGKAGRIGTGDGSSVGG